MGKKIPTHIQPLVRIFMWHQFISVLVLLFPVYILAMKNQGFSPLQISALISVWSVIGLTFEIPSGVWADQFSRRKVLLAAEVACVIGFIIMGFNQSIWGFGVGIALWGFRSTLYSGTYDAYMYDELVHHKAQDYFAALRSKTSMAMWLGITLSSSGIFIYTHYGWQTVVAGSILVRVISFIILWHMPEIGKAKVSEHPSFKTIITSSVHAIKTTHKILWLGLYGCSLGLVYTFYEFKTLLAQNWQLSTTTTTLFVGGCSVALFLGSYLAGKWPNKNLSIISCVGLAIVFIFVLAFNYNLGVWSALLFPISLIFYQWCVMQINVLQQHATPSGVRASVGSVISQCDALVSIALLQIIGLLVAQKGSYVAAGGSISAYLLVGHILCVLIILFKKCKDNPS